MISVAVMAHPRRAGFVDEMLERLDRPADVVFDHSDDEWDTGCRALVAFDRGASHHLVVQDDAVPCRDLVAGLERAVEQVGDHPIGLYCGQLDAAPPSFAPLADRALAEGSPWFRASGPHWGVAVVLPVPHLPEIVAAMDQRADVPNYDARIARWYRSAGIDCLYAMPSLVEHGPGPSLYPHRSADRRAHRFVGAEASALEVDWTRAAVTCPPRLAFRHRRSGREVSVARDTDRHRRLARNPTWELIECR